MSIESIVKPKRPTGPGWRRVRGELPLAVMGGFPFEVWAHDGAGLGVISTVEVAPEPGQPALGPEYHVSVSAFGARCSAADALWAIGQFGLPDAKEDNHVPGGKVRNFWRPVADNLSGIECGCIEVEPTIREDRGDYVWRGAQR